MPNDKADCPKKGVIKAKADDALDQLDTFIAQHPNLVLDLKLVKDNLAYIAQDNHKAQ
jgi:hypothetical protein